MPPAARMASWLALLSQARTATAAATCGRAPSGMASSSEKASAWCSSETRGAIPPNSRTSSRMAA
eukprot:218674-Prymnesium_polylepis.1